ncbi:YdcH family protein [Laribacter hongkongensis]|jgi:uncharacterized protein YdcH (DUF465 family)|uniref:DUF465 domain containing protein n=2 Tax=Laribacter hongkongensis TaxID=168471 RepID=C1D8S6_LARHH|nr:YdcH family protein [Laribacter hongkongensis]ACO74866.1 hypothetical protein LHK_01882 [Laribacter hongkongensis HLHK9]MBP8814167.1 YdcH family protein [Laribacter sp.]ASJ24807.1 DUF465 domain containing protein [Laribacter hongkongensis]MBE5527937.1 hypothetical protein [Laribacter hongkongensis]MBP9528400.1 YdcH family protein [Laribacter sp.]
MFPEYRDLIHKLKIEDEHFRTVFNRHNELDHKIKNMEDSITLATPAEVEVLKKEKLRLKDELYVMLKTASA